MSIVTQCDQCRQIFHEPFNGYDRLAPPVFRLTVNFGVTAMPNDRMTLKSSSTSHDFCSRACLDQYLDMLGKDGRLKQRSAPPTVRE